MSTSSMLDLFARLGGTIENEYRQANYDERRFPAISHAAVQAFDVPSRLDVDRLIEELLVHPTTLEPFKINDFGQPPVTVFRNRRFFIQVLFWLTSTTSIHQHAFPGAFQVLRGSSLHTTYRWSETERVNAGFQIGSAKWIRSELLRRGDSHAILPGDRFIHALFHLDHPSISMVVRTLFVDEARPQYKYDPPHFRHDPFEEDVALDLKLRLLAMLENSRDPSIAAACKSFARQAAFPEAYRALAMFPANSVPYRALLQVIKRRFPRWAARADRCAREVGRQAALIAQRNKITNDEHRFLLALLLNIRDRRDFLRLIRIRFPGEDPIDAVVRLVEELTLPDGGNARLLDISLDPHSIEVFSRMLRGLAGAALLKDLSKSFEVTRSQAKLLREFEAAFRASPLFSSLLAG